MGEGNGTPLLENPMDGGAWQATVQEVPKSWRHLSSHPTLLGYHRTLTGFPASYSKFPLAMGWEDPLEKGKATHPSIPVAAAAKFLQSCPTLCNPIDINPPGSPVPEILQAKTLQWDDRSQKWRGTLRFLPQLEKRPSSIEPNSVAAALTWAQTGNARLCVAGLTYLVTQARALSGSLCYSGYFWKSW